MTAKLEPHALPSSTCDNILGESNGVHLCLLALFDDNELDKSSSH